MVQKNKKKRGFSLAETTVALAVIAIVSGAAMSMVLSSADIEGSTMLTSYVINDAENVLDCFRYASTVGELKDVLNMANPEEDGSISEKWKITSNKIEKINGVNKRTVVCQLEQDNYTVILTLTLADADESDGELNEITIADSDYLLFSAVNRRDEPVMSTVAYTKQGVTVNE